MSDYIDTFKEQFYRERIELGQSEDSIDWEWLAYKWTTLCQYWRARALWAERQLEQQQSQPQQHQRVVMSWPYGDYFSIQQHAPTAPTDAVDSAANQQSNSSSQDQDRLVQARRRELQQQHGRAWHGIPVAFDENLVTTINAQRREQQLPQLQHQTQQQRQQQQQQQQAAAANTAPYTDESMQQQQHQQQAQERATADDDCYETFEFY